MLNKLGTTLKVEWREILKEWNQQIQHICSIDWIILFCN